MNIYVSNISFSLDEEELENVFAEYGTVSSVKIIVDKFSGKSKGFGFVEMDNETEAKSAIQNLNGFELGGRQLQVKEALPKKEKEYSNKGNYSNNNRGNNRRY
jgi:RNA recognition motif-containing protein